MMRQYTRSAHGLIARLPSALAALALALGLAGGARAQETGPSVAITALESQNFPAVTAYLTVTGANGLPLVGLTAENFSLKEDGQPVAAGTLLLESDTSQQLNVVLALDISVNAATLAQVQAAAVDFIGTLGPNDQVAVLSFYEQVVEAKSFSSDKGSLVAAIQNLTSGGNATAFNEAADYAVNLLSALPGGRKAVIMFTNSGDTSNTLSPEPTLAKAQANQIRIYPMAFGQNFNPDLMNNWARFSGGQAYVLASAGEIRSNLLTLGVLMRQSYKVSFQSGLKADNRTHTLDLTLNYQEQSAQAENKFTAVPGEVTVVGPGISNGQTVRGMVFLVADVTAPTDVKSVRFLLDEEPLAELTAPPYRFDWDTTQAEPGTHTLTVRAADLAGNQGESQVTVNVVLPPPAVVTVVPAATPVPVAGPSRLEVWSQNAVRVGGQVLAGAGLLLALILALVLFGRTRRSQRIVQVKTCQVEINNLGNVRSRYEVHAEDPSGALKFQFVLNEARVAPQTAAPVAASAAAPAKKRGGRPDNAVNQGLDVVETKANKALTVSETVSNWMMNVSYLMPGNAGRSLRSNTSQMRSAQYNVQQGVEMRGRVERTVKAAAVPIPLGKPQPAVVGAPAAAAPTAVGNGAAGNGLAPNGSGVSNILALSAPALTPAASRPGWSVTPAIEPGQSLALQLLVSPGRAPKSQLYAFRVLSRAAEDAEAAPAIEHGSVALQGLPWHRRIASAVLLLVALALLASLVWYLLATFGVMG